MYDNEGNLYVEEVIEDVYKVNLSDCSSGHIHTLKMPAGNKGKRMTDGWMNFKYTETVKGFHGIHECKRGSAASVKKLPYQLAQAIKYYWEICVSLKKQREKDFKVFCLTSEKYFAYVYKEDIQALLDSLNELFESDDCPPNELANKPYKHKSIIETITKYDIPFHIKEMPTDVDLANIARDIYIHCLD